MRLHTAETAAYLCRGGDDQRQVTTWCGSGDCPLTAFATIYQHADSLQCAATRRAVHNCLSLSTRTPDDAGLRSSGRIVAVGRLQKVSETLRNLVYGAVRFFTRKWSHSSLSPRLRHPAPLRKLIASPVEPVSQAPRAERFHPSRASLRGRGGPPSATASSPWAYSPRCRCAKPFSSRGSRKQPRNSITLRSPPV